MGAILRPYLNLMRGFGPQVKPTSVPQIDWTHPLTKGLVTYWFDLGTGRYLDLVTGRLSVLDPSGLSLTSAGPPSPSPWGVATNFNTSTNGQHPSALGDGSVALNQVWNAPYTYACAINHTSTTNFTGGATTSSIWGLSDSSNNTPFAISYATAVSPTQTVFEFGNTSSVTGYTISANKLFVPVGVATSSGNATCYVNGTVQGTLSAGTTNFTGTNCHYCMNAGGWNDSSGTTSGSPNLQIFWAAGWQNRALSQQDALLLYTDPYCFLLPAEYEMPALFVAAAATVVRSYYRRNIIRAAPKGFR